MASDIEEDDYYDCSDDDGMSEDPQSHGDLVRTDPEDDPEYFSYICLSEQNVRDLFARAINELSALLKISPGQSQELLVRNQWDLESVCLRYNGTTNLSHVEQKLNYGKLAQVAGKNPVECLVCLQLVPCEELAENVCGHSFCTTCWNSYLEEQVGQGRGFEILCMGWKCDALVTEELALKCIENVSCRQKYQRNLFRECVRTHPQLQSCPTFECPTIFHAEHPESSRVECSKCKASCCFACGCEYHLPCDCRTIRQWWKKVLEDSETMSYISAYTKDCPICQSNIEKNGGCNHMVCRICTHEFCWICLGEWKDHGTGYYECNKFSKKQAAATVTEPTGNSERRLALNKYLFYFQRWKNHEQSLSLEEATIHAIEARVQTQLKERGGSLIDWQFLMDAGKLLLKCRRALQYTYAFAYFLEDGPNRQLFEHLQAELESGIENLSFSVERSQTMDVAKMQAEMRSAEFRRRTLFRDAKVLSQKSP